MPEFLIWSIEHGAWWRPGSMGYTRRVDLAGRYTSTEAEAIVRRANGPHLKPGEANECCIPIECLTREDAPRLGASHAHVWIDREEVPTERTPYAPAEMKPGRTYHCRDCGSTVTLPTHQPTRLDIGL